MLCGLVETGIILEWLIGLQQNTATLWNHKKSGKCCKDKRTPLEEI